MGCFILNVRMQHRNMHANTFTHTHTHTYIHANYTHTHTTAYSEEWRTNGLFSDGCNMSPSPLTHHSASGDFSRLLRVLGLTVGALPLSPPLSAGHQHLTGPLALHPPGTAAEGQSQQKVTTTQALQEPTE